MQNLCVQDYQGNNRLVVNASNNAVEQMNHYYSYGNLMGTISTKPDAQPFKYGGKELDLAGSALDITDRFPNVIYQRIKEQKPGQVIPCKR